MPVNAVQLFRAVVGDEGPSDADLLRRFIDRRDEAAFVLLVRRHAPMVWGVCRRILPTDPDAEDAFQATFLVLAQKARAVPRDAVGNWLYGVARRAALLARRTITRRRERVGEMDEVPAPEPLDELRATLDEELSRLPDAYRTVIVLCDLEGRTRREASAELGWPEGTVAGRLVRAREMLAKRMARHAPSVSLVAVLAGTASARVPEVFTATATIPSGVAALTQEILSAMFRGTLMKTAAAAFVLACTVFGMALYAGQTPDPEKPLVPAAAPVKPAKADDVAWGEEIDGLQIGITRVARAYRHGETMKPEVKLRNVGNAEVKISYGLYRDHAPEVTAADGERMSVYMPLPLGIKVKLVVRVIKPGETITLYNSEVVVESEDRAGMLGEMRVETPTICVGAAKYKIAYGRMVQSHPKLATGVVEFEIRDTTAWGKEVGGLQAGLGFPAGQKRAYAHGETVTLFVRVRNVGKEAVKFEYIGQYLDENPPGVTGADGVVIPQATSKVMGVIHVPVKVSLEPGKEVVLETRIHGAAGVPYELRPSGGGGAPATRGHPLKVGTGKITLQYERVFGSSSIGRLQIDPALARLATGKLELEVTDAEQKGSIHLPTHDGMRELKGKEAEAYQTTNAWLAERLKEANSIKVGSTYADVCKHFHIDGGLSEVRKSRFVMVLCPYIKIDVEFEQVKGGAVAPTAKVTKVSRPYFEPAFLD